MIVGLMLGRTQQPVISDLFMEPAADMQAAVASPCRPHAMQHLRSASIEVGRGSETCALPDGLDIHLLEMYRCLPSDTLDGRMIRYEDRSMYGMKRTFPIARQAPSTIWRYLRTHK